MSSPSVGNTFRMHRMTVSLCDHPDDDARGRLRGVCRWPARRPVGLLRRAVGHRVLGRVAIRGYASVDVYEVRSTADSERWTKWGVEQRH